ncbi:MAG: tetratricopeptide repeat protein [Vicingaceae bacterium]
MSAKQNTRKIQLLLILAGVVFLVAILLAPQQMSNEATDDELEQLESLSEEDHDHEHEHESEAKAIATQEASLESIEDPAVKAKFESLSNKANQVADIDTKLLLYDSLIALSIQQNKPPLVAKYSGQKAQAVPTENNWLLAGDNYFKAFRLSKNKSKPMIEGTVASYQEVLALNEANLKAQTALGVAYVEGASMLGVMPMKGIGMLKDVLNSDPENIDALTNLGYFAIQSGQYEKAIERFNSILKIDPKNAEAYIYLTDVYLSQNQVQKGIETLEQYKSLVDDPLAKQQVDEYIEELKNK